MSPSLPNSQPPWTDDASARQAANWPTRRVIVTGGGGFLGSAVVGVLISRGVATSNIYVPRRAACDLTNPAQAAAFMHECAASNASTFPDVVIHCAGAVGGIQANRDQPGRFFYANMAMALNVIETCREAWSREHMLDRAAIVQVGSMTSYPSNAPIPYREPDLWTGYPPADSSPYGVAKLAAWQMLDAYHKQYALRSGYVIPVNLYGPGDNIDDVRNAHVAGSLIKRFVDAARAGTPEVVCWGTGSPMREFLFIDDAAEGVIRAAERALTIDPSPTPINLGSGNEVTIKALAETIAALASYQGKVSWDTTKPDGLARRSLDVSRAQALLGFSAKMPLNEGLRRTIEWYTKRSI